MGDPAPASETPPLATLPGRGSVWGTCCAWVVVVAWLIIATLLAIFIGLPAALLGDRQRRVTHRLLSFGFAGMRFWLFPYRLTLTGVENLPPGPCILAANHHSLADVVFLSSLPRHFKWIVKKEFFRVPLFGIAMRIADYPVIDRGDTDSALALVDVVGEQLKAGVAILSFPEGTRSANGELQSFQTGTARMAIMNQVPLVPIGVAGTGMILPKNSAAFSIRGHVGIHIGEPIVTTGMERSRVRKLTRELREAVQETMNQAKANRGNA